MAKVSWKRVNGHSQDPRSSYHLGGMLPTPDLSHLKRKDYENIYEPAEDTFILLDALEGDAAFLRESKPTICLEIGSGSGCVMTFLANITGPSLSLYLSTDINPEAAKATVSTGLHNGITVECILTSLCGSMMSRLKGHVDILLFNPPYVPTGELESSEAQERGKLAGAWAGGTDGMRITNVLLQDLNYLLSLTGRFYLVALQQNKPEEIIARMKDQSGLNGRVILERRAGGERLYVLLFTR